MNPLDSFTVERLEQLARGDMPESAWRDEMQELAKIALTLKQTKIMVNIDNLDGEDLLEMVGEFYKTSGGSGIMIPVQGCSWIKCSERMPKMHEKIIFNWDGIVWAGSIESDYYGNNDLQNLVYKYIVYFGEKIPLSEIDSWMPLPAAPKPE